MDKFCHNCPSGVCVLGQIFTYRTKRLAEQCLELSGILCVATATGNDPNNVSRESHHNPNIRKNGVYPVDAWTLTYMSCRILGGKHA